jgi:hypothetical protein
MLTTVMNGKRQADKVWQYCRTARPSFDRLFIFIGLCNFNFFTKLASQNGPFFAERVMFFSLIA